MPVNMNYRALAVEIYRPDSTQAYLVSALLDGNDTGEYNKYSLLNTSDNKPGRLNDTQLRVPLGTLACDTSA